MKLLTELRTPQIQEESNDDTRHLDMLVRAGLANKAQLQRIHKIVARMGDEKPVFSQADRMIIQNLFTKMVDLLTNNPQIFQKAKTAVREEGEIPEDAILVESDLEEGLGGPQNDPPIVLILKRQSIRIYPDKTKVALYYNQKMDKYFTVPYRAESSGPREDPGISTMNGTNESVELTEDTLDHLSRIKIGTAIGNKVVHADKSTSKVDPQTANAVLTVHAALNPDNQKKFREMMHKSRSHFSKAVDFAWKKVK